MAVNMIFAPHRSAANARDKLRAALKDAAERAVFPLSGPIEARFKIGRKLISELIELDTVIEYASAESANFRIQANHARGLVAHLFSLISARRALDAHLARCGWPPHDALDIFHGVIIDFLHEMPGKIDRNEIDDLIAGLDDVHDQLNRPAAGGRKRYARRRCVRPLRHRPARRPAPQPPRGAGRMERHSLRSLPGGAGPSA